MRKTHLFVIPCLLFAAAVQAQVSVKDAWVRATVPQQQATGAFMRLVSASSLTLVQASSAVAGVVEIHQMSMQGDVMKMHQVAGIELPAGKVVELKPGGYHIMMMGLKQALKEGDSVPLTLVFENPDKKRENVEIKVPVRALNGMPAMGGKP